MSMEEKWTAKPRKYFGRTDCQTHSLAQQDVTVTRSPRQVILVKKHLNNACLDQNIQSQVNLASFG